MIVVVGGPAWRTAEPAGPDGRACRIALAAADRGAAVELVGRAGDDPAGDALMLALARAGVGHVALLRDPARPTPIVAPVPDDATSITADAPEGASGAAHPTDGPVLEPADISLGLRYLPTYDVIVVTDDVVADALPVAADAAAYAGAQLIVLIGDVSTAADLPPSASVLEVPADDHDGVFAALVGAYAAALDAGASPADAFATARGAAWERPWPERTT